MTTTKINTKVKKTELTQGSINCKGCIYKTNNPSIDNCSKRYSVDASKSCLAVPKGIFVEVLV